MEFEIRQLPDYSRSIRLKYTMPNGERKYVEQMISAQSYVGSNVMSPTLDEHVKNALQERANHDIQEYVRNNAQGGNMILHDTACYPDTVLATSTSTNTVAWYGQGTAADNFTMRYTWEDVATQGTNPYVNVVDDTGIRSWTRIGGKQKIKLRMGRRFLLIEKEQDENGELVVDENDILAARERYYKDMQFNIISKRAERKAEDLLKMFVSEIDFRNYKKNGYFSVKQGNKIYRIWRDNHKWVDMWEKDEKTGLLVPKNRLCTHTEKRDIPLADEVVAKLMLIKSNRIHDHANFHAIDEDMKKVVEERELVLV